jgi:hypothetical protein
VVSHISRKTSEMWGTRLLLARDDKEETVAWLIMKHTCP